jgi:hypothetical protein
VEPYWGKYAAGCYLINSFKYLEIVNNSYYLPNVTNDEDFLDFANIKGFPPRVILLKFLFQPELICRATTFLSGSEHLCLVSEHLCSVNEHLCSVSEHLCSVNEHLCPVSEHLCPVSEHLCPVSEHLCHVSEHLCHVSEHLCSVSEHFFDVKFYR